jgi:hypothetical protein
VKLRYFRALWDGRLPDGRTGVADGLAILTTAEEPYWTSQLCRAGLAVEAAAARPDPLYQLGTECGAHTAPTSAASAKAA